MRREWIEMYEVDTLGNVYSSPSMRREWIEIFTPEQDGLLQSVSLHAEGVD